MAITKVHPDMISPTVVKTTDRASNAGGGTEGQVVQLTDANKIHTVYLDDGTTDGKIVQAGGSDKIATSLIDTGTTDGKIVQMTTGDKLPAVNGSLLTSIIEALPAGMPLQIQSTQTSAESATIIDSEVTVGAVTYWEDTIPSLSVNITPVRLASKFKIDVTWFGGLDTSASGDGTSSASVITNLGFYLVQIVDVGGDNTTSNLQGVTEGDRNPVIANVSISTSDTTAGTLADKLFNSKFSYITTPSYTLEEVLSFTMAVRVDDEDPYLVTNRSVDSAAVNNGNSLRPVSSIVVTEIRGA